MIRTETTPQEAYDMTIDYYARTHAIVAGLLPEVDNHRQPRAVKAGQRSRARLCYSFSRSKGPALVTPRSRGCNPHRQAGFCHARIATGARLRVSAWFRGWERLSARTAARRDPCDYPHPHQYGLVSLLVFQVSSRSEPMTQAATLVRIAASSISHASRRAVPIQSTTDTIDPQILGLHIAAENALAAALGLLRNPSGTTADLQRATARACRAATPLKRACAAQAEASAV